MMTAEVPTLIINLVKPETHLSVLDNDLFAPQA